MKKKINLTRANPLYKKKFSSQHTPWGGGQKFPLPLMGSMQKKSNSSSIGLARSKEIKKTQLIHGSRLQRCDEDLHRRDDGNCSSILWAGSILLHAQQSLLNQNYK